VRVESATALERYRYGKALVFCRCGRCGCVTHHERVTRRADGRDTLAINVRNADDPAAIARLPMRLLDGADTWCVLRETVEPDLFLSPADER
jgi:hypothetical protein